MIRICILLVFSACWLSNSLCQTKTPEGNCDCSVLLDPSFRASVNVFDAPNGKVKKKIQHNIAEEDMVVLSIIGKKNGFFKIVAAYSIAGHITDGWINKENPIGIFARNYYNEELHLFRAPNKKDAPLYIIKKYTPAFLKITDCSVNGWAKAKFNHNGNVRQGWISREDQCDNPYTTCN